MASRFSDIFSSNENEQNSTNDTNADQNVDANADASNDGISLSNESYSQNEDGEVTYDATNLDTGATNLDVDGMVDSMVSSLSDSSSSSGDTSILD